VDVLDACAGHLRLVVVTSQLVSFAPWLLDAVGLRAARFARPGVRITTVGVTSGIDDRRELERACAAHVVDTPDQLGRLVLGL
jgi:hypothetical protein